MSNVMFMEDTSARWKIGESGGGWKPKINKTIQNHKRFADSNKTLTETFLFIQNPSYHWIYSHSNKIYYVCATLII